jgi:hypothetical protein
MSLRGSERDRASGLEQACCQFDRCSHDPHEEQKGSGAYYDPEKNECGSPHGAPESFIAINMAPARANIDIVNFIPSAREPWP